METTSNPAPTAGTVLSGTMRIQDIVTAMFHELDFYTHHVAAEIAEQNYWALTWALAAADARRRSASPQRWQTYETLDILRDHLEGALNEVGAPHGLYWGPNENDPADHGWWDIEQEDEF